MDLSSNSCTRCWPVFLVTTLGMSVTRSACSKARRRRPALIVKVFSGPISDYLGRRKGLLLLGYGLAALTKPLFPLATTPALVVTARLLDRVGKGIRGAPRDALVADVAPPEIRGRVFRATSVDGHHRRFPWASLAIVLMFWFADHIRTVLWFAGRAGLVAVGLIAFGIDESARRRLIALSGPRCIGARCANSRRATG